jgi:hypothetical protein
MAYDFKYLNVRSAGMGILQASEQLEELSELGYEIKGVLDGARAPYTHIVLLQRKRELPVGDGICSRCGTECLAEEYERGVFLCEECRDWTGRRP